MSSISFENKDANKQFASKFGCVKRIWHQITDKICYAIKQNGYLIISPILRKNAFSIYFD